MKSVGTSKRHPNWLSCEINRKKLCYKISVCHLLAILTKFNFKTCNIAKSASYSNMEDQKYFKKTIKRSRVVPRERVNCRHFFAGQQDFQDHVYEEIKPINSKSKSSTSNSSRVVCRNVPVTSVKISTR